MGSPPGLRARSCQQVVLATSMDTRTAHANTAASQSSMMTSRACYFVRCDMFSRAWVGAVQED